MIDLDISIKIDARVDLDMNDFAGEEELINMVKLNLGKEMYGLLTYIEPMRTFNLDIDVQYREDKV